MNRGVRCVKIWGSHSVETLGVGGGRTLSKQHLGGWAGGWQGQRQAEGAGHAWPGWSRGMYSAGDSESTFVRKVTWPDEQFQKPLP